MEQNEENNPNLNKRRKINYDNNNESTSSSQETNSSQESNITIIISAGEKEPPFQEISMRLTQKRMEITGASLKGIITKQTGIDVRSNVIMTNYPYCLQDDMTITEWFSLIGATSQDKMEWRIFSLFCPALKLWQLAYDGNWGSLEKEIEGINAIKESVKSSGPIDLNFVSPIALGKTLFWLLADNNQWELLAYIIKFKLYKSGIDLNMLLKDWSLDNFLLKLAEAPEEVQDFVCLTLRNFYPNKISLLKTTIAQLPKNISSKFWIQSIDTDGFVVPGSLNNVPVTWKGSQNNQITSESPTISNYSNFCYK